jgi:hypothetical protein
MENLITHVRKVKLVAVHRILESAVRILQTFLPQVTLSSKFCGRLY